MFMLSCINILPGLLKLFEITKAVSQSMVLGPKVMVWYLYVLGSVVGGDINIPVEPRYEKNCLLHMRKQRRRSAAQ